MESRIDILNELRELSPLLAGMEKTNVFSVPEGYFESLSADIQASLAEEAGIVFETDSRIPKGSVPQGYFENLAGTILNRVKQVEAVSAGDELRGLSPMLYSIQGAETFKVPAGYFESLSGSILSKIAPQSAKVVTLRSRTMSIFKYAVAAAFTGVMALGVFKFTGDSSSRTVLDPVVLQGTQIAKENRFEEELAKVSDADIVKYLESSGSEVDAALVANSVDANELPSQEDYLNDEKALDNYLNNINPKELNN